MALRLVARAEWGARAPRRRSRGRLTGPTTCHWTGPAVRIGGQATWDHARCAQIIRGIQNFHMDGRGWSDIAYNFVECPHGYTFEGRGLGIVNAANGTTAANNSSHAICCLAGEGNPFPMEERAGFKDAVAYIAREAGAQNRAVGHRDHKSTTCPGGERHAWVHAGMPVDETPPAPPAPGPVPTPVIEADTVLRRGSRGPAVAWLQNILNLKTGPLAVDQDFGPATEARVRAVQRVFGLEVDGIVGPQTRGALGVLEASTHPFGAMPFSDKPFISHGASNNHFVAYAQEVLNLKFGAGLAVDGDFGPRTTGAVRAVQQRGRLAVDGIVGPDTWQVIDRAAVS